ncbi:hypothetical protein CN355_29550 [Bacillus thuringiensis]|nr:hypothetical protein CN355_29550 [Bacillus thuringiensis]
MQCPLLSRQDLKSTTKQPEFYIYRDSGYLISFKIFDDYKKYIFVQGKFNPIRFAEGILLSLRKSSKNFMLPIY